MTTRTKGSQARRLVCGLAVTLLSGAALTAADSIDASTLNGKVLLGYQGWFNCPGDGSPRENWRSWSRSVPAADTLTIDIYPDLSELTPAERCLVPGMTIGGKPVTGLSVRTLLQAVFIAALGAAGFVNFCGRERSSRDSVSYAQKGRSEKRRDEAPELRANRRFNTDNENRHLPTSVAVSG